MVLNDRPITLQNKIAAYTRPLAVAAAVLSAIIISVVPVGTLWAVLALALCVAGGLMIVRFPFLVLSAVLLIAPLAAYEARAGLPYIGRLPIAFGQIVFGGAIWLWLCSWLVRKERRFPRAKSFTWLLLFAVFFYFALLGSLIVRTLKRYKEYTSQ